MAEPHEAPDAQIHGDLAIDLLSAAVFAQCGADPTECDLVVKSLRQHAHSSTAIGTAAGLLRHHLRLAEARELVEQFPGWEDEFALLCEHAEIAAAEGPLRHDGGSTEGPASARLDDRGGYSEADYDLARARRLHPYAVRVVRRQVHLWNARRRFADSMLLLDQFRQRYRGHYMIEQLTAETEVLRGNGEAAVRICEDLLAHFEPPGRPPIQLRIMHLRSVRATGDLERALQLARDLLHDFPVSRRARLTLARCLEDFNETSEALNHLERCLRELPLYPPVGENAAMFCRLRREYARGHTLIRQALAHYNYKSQPEEVYDRADSGLLAELILILASEGRLERAGHCVNVLKARSDVYSRSLGHISAGWYEIYRDDPDAAEMAFNAAIATDHCVNEARYGLGQALMRQADRTSASAQRRSKLEQARAAAQQNIDDADSERSLVLAGQASYELGNWEEAEDLFRRSIRVHPVHGGHLELAVVLNHQGRLDEALEAAESGAKWTPSDPRLLAIMGLTRLRMVVEEQREDSRLLKQGALEIDRALEAAPTDPTVLSALVYAANHTALYVPMAAHAYVKNALKDSWNQLSMSAMAHLNLMLTELALRYGRIYGIRLNLWRRGASYWARRALRYTDDPRALAIATSFRHKRQIAKIASNRPEHRTNGERANGGSLDVPRWIKQAVPVVGLLMIALGVAAIFTDRGPQSAAVLFGAGAAFLLAGPVLHRLNSFSFGLVKVDISPTTEMARTLNIPSGPPVRPLAVSPSPPVRAVVMPQTPVNRSDAQWRVAESHRQLLGPAVGPMITGHYTYRDANFPWKTR